MTGRAAGDAAPLEHLVGAGGRRWSAPPPNPVAHGVVPAAALQPDPSALGAGPWPAPLPCGEPPVRDVEPMSDAELAHMALDALPDAGQRAPQHLLGPWADALDPHDPWQRRAWRAAVAASALTVADDLTRSPARAWTRDDPRPPAEARRALVVVRRAPVMMWGLRAGLTGWHLRPLLPLASWWCPEGPVALDEVGGVAGPPADGGVLVGRMVPCPSGWRARVAFVVPCAPPEDALAAAWSRLVASEQATNPIVRREDVLRRAGHHLVRVTHVAAWQAHVGGAAGGLPGAGGIGAAAPLTRR